MRFLVAALITGSLLAPPVLAENRYSSQLMGLHHQARREILRRLLHGAGERCPGVTRTMVRGENRGTAYWAVECGKAGSWMIAIAPDSSTKIVSCAIIAKLKSSCWTKF